MTFGFAPRIFAQSITPTMRKTLDVASVQSRILGQFHNDAKSDVGDTFIARLRERSEKRTNSYRRRLAAKSATTQTETRFSPQALISLSKDTTEKNSPAKRTQAGNGRDNKKTTKKKIVVITHEELMTSVNRQTTEK